MICTISNTTRKYALFFSFIFVSLLSFGQYESILSELEKADISYNESKNKISDGIKYLNKYYSSTSLTSMQVYLQYAINEFESAKRYCWDAEECMQKSEEYSSYENCWESIQQSTKAKELFSDANYDIKRAIDNFTYAIQSDNPNNLIDYANTGIDYLDKSISELDNGKAILFDVLEAVKECVNEISNNQNNPLNCEELMAFIKSQGSIVTSLYDYNLNSRWLREVKAYRYNNKIYVIAKIKIDEYSYKTKEYIFCEVPSVNWNKFNQVDFLGKTTYGERFHSYIFPHQCNCE